MDNQLDQRAQNSALSTPPPPTPPPPTPPLPTPPARQPKPKEPTNPGTIAAVVLCMAAALAFNLALQSRVASVGTAIGVVLTVAMILQAPKRRRLPVYAPSAIAIGAAAVMTVRASPWITGPATLAIIASLILASQDGLGALLTPAFNYLGDIPRSLPWFKSVTNRLTLESSASSSIGRGVALAAILVIVLVSLLASGDAVFANILETIAGQSTIGHVLLTAFLIVPLATLGVASTNTKQRNRSESQPPTRPGGAVEGLIVLGSVVAVLGFWSAAQIAVAIGGAERFLNLEDLSLIHI